MKNSKSIMMSISTKDDLDLLKENHKIKYLNIDLTDCHLEVIEYLKDYGQNYFYSDMINSKNGYIYVDYDTFVHGEMIIDKIILDMSSNFNDLEKAKYLYVSLGKILSYDINILPEKNEIFNYINVSTINNIWGALTNKKATNTSFVKIYYYLCSILNLDNEIISVNNFNYLCNKLNIEDNTLIVDLTKDIPFIQSNFKTRFFATYNDDIELDKNIGYIKKAYNEQLIEKVMKKINFKDNDFLEKMLLDTQDILKVSNIKPIELGVIYDLIFSKYCPNYDISINNLFIKDIYNNKEHFILISYNDEHYSFNFKKNSFVKITDDQLLKNIKRNKIGVYLDEKIPNLILSEEGVI